MRMNRLLLLALLTLLLAVAPAAHAARGFKFGVAAGDVTSSSAVMWGKATKAGGYSLDVATNRRFRNFKPHFVVARKSHDNTVQLRVRRLKPNTRYWFRFVGNHRTRSAVGRFRTAPKASQDRAIRFAWSGDQDFNTEPGKTQPFWNDGGVLRQMKAERNAFNVMLGDTIYTDSEVPGRLRPLALTVRRKWAKYKINLGISALRALRGSAGYYSQWDDHEFVNDFSPNQNTFHATEGVQVNMNGHTLLRRGRQAFRDYAPVHWTKRDGLYRKFRWGRNLELFFLDERSFRSANADIGGACNNPQTGSQDFAPTLPQPYRTAFSALYAPLAETVPKACLHRIHAKSRTFLGQRQRIRFLRDVKRSKARFKVIMNELPIQQYYINPYDGWEGFEADRQRVLHGLQGVKNVVFLSTDVHATLVNDARFRTLEPGGPKNSGITDISVGPSATRNFSLELENATGRPGIGTVADSLFLTPQPPGGVGMRCAVLDKFSYGEVEVTKSRLTVTPKDIDGKQLTDNDAPCGPFVFDFKP
jgi:phosphodiesterase/alkaline phosphatase D-like protein